MILDMMSKNEGDHRAIDSEIALSKSTIMRTVNKLKDDGKIERIGGPKGTWVITGP